MGGRFDVRCLKPERDVTRCRGMVTLTPLPAGLLPSPQPRDNEYYGVLFIADTSPPMMSRQLSFSGATKPTTSARGILMHRRVTLCDIEPVRSRQYVVDRCLYPLMSHQRETRLTLLTYDCLAYVYSPVEPFSPSPFYCILQRYLYSGCCRIAAGDVFSTNNRPTVGGFSCQPDLGRLLPGIL